MKIRDTIERVFWSTVAAALGAVPSAALFDVETWKLAASAGVTGAVTAVLVYARYRLKVLPDPGDGLPGLPT